MDENNNTNTNPVTQNDQDLELKKLLDRYSNEANQSSETEGLVNQNFEQQQESPQPNKTEMEVSPLSSGFESQIPPKAEEPLTSNFESPMEQSSEMIPNQESSLNSGFSSQIPPQMEPPIVNNFENTTDTQSNFIPKKGFNFFKFLFIISLLIFLGVLAGLAYISINSQKTEEISEPTSIPTIPIETVMPTEPIIPTAIPEITVIPAISPTATPTAVVTEVSNPSPTPIFSVYKNDRVGYQFEYPSRKLEVDLNETIKYPSEKPGDAKNEDLVQFVDKTISYTFKTTIGVNYSSTKEWIQTQLSTTNDNYFNLNNFTQIIIGDNVGFKRKNELRTYVVFNKNLYEITAFSGVAPSKNLTDPVYKHLLESFKFISI